MTEFFDGDTFFLLTRIATIVFAVLAFVAIIYAIAILRDVKSVTRGVKGGAKEVGKDALPILRSIFRALGSLFLVSLVKKINGSGKKRDVLK